MITYLVIDKENKVLRRGSVTDEANLPHVTDDKKLEIVSADDTRWPSQTFPVTHADVRMSYYPSVGDQLDMLWHAMDDGVLPLVEPWYSTIKAVKLAHPKTDD